tara:strand:- start:484 stop:648 length:165 start_codon:yes stop_codon:yes gene_type:complete
MREIIIPDEVSKSVRFPREMVIKVELECREEHLDFSKFMRRAVDLYFEVKGGAE